MLIKNQSAVYIQPVAAQPAQPASTTCPPTPPQPPSIPLSGWSFIYTLKNVDSGQVVTYFLYQGSSTNVVTLEAPYNAAPWTVINVAPEYNP